MSLVDDLSKAAQEMELSPRTIRAYKATWTQLVAWGVVRDLSLEDLPPEPAKVIYTELTGGRGASHHVQVQSALSFLYGKFWKTTNPFKDCPAPKFNIERVELKYLTGSQIGMLLQELAKSTDYYGRLTATLAEALFRTARRYHEWSEMTQNRLVGTGDQLVARMQTKGGRFSDIPISARLAESIRSWREFLDAVKGIRVRTGSIEFSGSQLVFPGRNGGALSNQAFNKRLKEACIKTHIPIITAHGLRHSAATLLLNEAGRNLREVQTILGHKSLSTTARYTHVDQSRMKDMINELSTI